MKIDYTAICACGFEVYDNRLARIKKDSEKHVEGCEAGDVFIDRNRDQEIDDTFNTIRIKAA